MQISNRAMYRWSSWISFHRPNVSTIRIDYLNGIRQAIQHLAALRHRKIAFISGPRKLKSAAAREQAFLQSMKEISLRPDPQLIVEGDHTLEGGYRVCSSLFSDGRKTTAVVCSNDLTAMGVMKRCYELGIQIPKDLSVIGFDDIRLAQFTLPPLTTVQMSQSELARLAFHALITEVGRKQASTRGAEYELKTSLILRNSTSIIGSAA